MALVNPPDDIDFDLIAASLRADATDLNAFIEVLATKLESTLPAVVEVRRVRQGFRGPKLVEQIAVQTAGARLELRRRGPAVEALKAKTSGGIVLKTESVDIDHWLVALTEIIGAEAQRNLQTREALARLLDTA